MATNKTTETKANASDFISQITGEAKCSNAIRLVDIFQNQTNLEPKI
jgi:hypothetical protein